MGGFKSAVKWSLFPEHEREKKMRKQQKKAFKQQCKYGKYGAPMMGPGMGQPPMGKYGAPMGMMGHQPATVVVQQPQVVYQQAPPAMYQPAAPAYGQPVYQQSSSSSSYHAPPTAPAYGGYTQAPAYTHTAPVQQTAYNGSGGVYPSAIANQAPAAAAGKQLIQAAFAPPPQQTSYVTGKPVTYY